MTLVVRVTPNAKIESIKVEPDYLSVRLRAAAVEGKANAALLKKLAKVLNLRRSQVKLVSGTKSRLKRLFVDGLDATTLAQKLSEFQ